MAASKPDGRTDERTDSQAAPSDSGLKTGPKQAQANVEHLQSSSTLREFKNNQQDEYPSRSCYCFSSSLRSADGGQRPEYSLTAGPSGNQAHFKTEYLTFELGCDRRRRVSKLSDSNHLFQWFSGWNSTLLYEQSIPLHSIR